MKDRVVFAIDKDLYFAFAGLLARPEALGIRPIERDIFSARLRGRGIP